jgi:hypothetical protein
MNHKVGLTIALLFSMISGVFALFSSSAAARAAEPFVVDEAVKQQILASTLQIAIYEQASAGAPYADGDRGLASLVLFGGQRYIVTHDHWTHLTAKLDQVEIRNASGGLLMVLDRTSFGQLIRYRDGGTMVLEAPDGLQGVVPAEVAFGSPVGPGEAVWSVRRSPDNGSTSTEVVSSRVEAIDMVGIPQRIELRSLDGQGLVPGDSGGGIWQGGSLLGNVWAAGVQEGQATSLIIAALHPFEQTGAPALQTVAGHTAQLHVGLAR